MSGRVLRVGGKVVVPTPTGIDCDILSGLCCSVVAMVMLRESVSLGLYGNTGGGLSLLLPFFLRRATLLKVIRWLGEPVCVCVCVCGVCVCGCVCGGGISTQ